MELKAHAKINLGLHVVGRRNDGFHDIETIFHRIQLHDEITIEPSSGIELSTSAADLPADSGNLCWKAVAALHSELAVADGIRIHIAKNIPIGAGLGGGSSDAAAILKNAPLLWNRKITREQLERLALQLGSDVPFFLSESSAYAEGRGERLSYFHLRLPFWIVVVNPKIHVATPWAYKALSEKRNGVFPDRPSLRTFFPDPPLDSILSFGNDFEEIVFDRYPDIARIKTSLLHLGAARALMSGSGSSVFALFENESDAKYASAEFSKTYFTHVTEPT